MQDIVFELVSGHVADAVYYAQVTTYVGSKVADISTGALSGTPTYANTAVDATEPLSDGRVGVKLPSWLLKGRYRVVLRQRATGVALETDDIKAVKIVRKTSDGKIVDGN